MRTKFIIYYLFLLFLVSCDYETGLKGEIIDKETGKPIAGATVNLLDGKDIQKTNADGFFSVLHASGHSLPHPKVLITMKGYKPFQLELDQSDNYKIYKVKSETKYIKFNKRFYYTPSDTSSYSEGIDIEKWSTDFLAGDTLKLYLSKDDEKTEIEKLKSKIKKNWEAHTNNN